MERTVRLLEIYFVLIKYQFKVTQYNTLNVKSSNSKLNKLTPGINGTGVTLIFYQMWLAIPIMRVILHIKYCWLIDKF